MRTSFTILATAALAAVAAASPVQNQPRATPAAGNGAAPQRRQDFIISSDGKGGITCNQVGQPCPGGSGAVYNSMCQCPNSPNMMSGSVVVSSSSGSGGTTIAESGTGAPAFTFSPLTPNISSLDIVAPTSTSATSSPTRSPAASVTPTPNGAAVNVPGFKAAAAGLALGAAAFLL